MEAKKEFTGHKHKREESKSFTVSKVTKENVITIPMNKNEILQGLFTYIKEYLTELNKWHQQKINDLPSKEKIIKFYNKYVHLDKEFGGDWGLGIGPNPQSPIPNPQSPKRYYYLLITIIIYYN